MDIPILVHTKARSHEGLRAVDDTRRKDEAGAAGYVGDGGWLTAGSNRVGGHNKRESLKSEN
jgi:hypothetical protein